MSSSPRSEAADRELATISARGSYLWHHLLGLDRESLYYNLGVQAARQTEPRYESVSLESMSEGERAHEFPPSELIGQGRRQFGRVEEQVRKLLCGTDEGDSAERDKLWQMIQIAMKATRDKSAIPTAEASQESLVAFGGSALSLGKSFLISSGLAEYVAALLLQKIVMPAADEGRQAMCVRWAEASRTPPPQATATVPAPAAHAAPAGRDTGSRR